MSLRVLLADESDTIKKVFQLALQDLNAEIKSVHSGLDVIDVAQTFKPNIIFADVLLQKKNGYDTCRQIKQNAQLSAIPVVLMWSSFMELDQDQYKKSLASDQLEKPFDADFLRGLIKKHVPQVQDNPMAQFLQFPKSISSEMKVPKPSSSGNVKTLDESPTKEDTSEFNIASFLDEKLPGASEDSRLKMPNAPISIPDAPVSEEAWLSADLSKFKIDTGSSSDGLEKFEALNLGQQEVPSKSSDSLPSFSMEPSQPSTLTRKPLSLPENDLAEPEEKTDDISISRASVPNPLDSLLSFDPPSASIKAPNTSTETKTRHRNSMTEPPPESALERKVATTIGLNDDQIEAIIRAHTEEIIKTQISETLVDIIEKIVRDELSKMLEEEVRLKQEFSSDNA